MPNTPVCASCGVEMEGGFLLEHSGSGPANTLWVEGPPERSRWTGLKLRGRRQLPTYAWRCPRCSEVRLYAADE